MTTTRDTEVVRQAAGLVERGEGRAAVDLLQRLAVGEDDRSAEEVLPAIRHAAAIASIEAAVGRVGSFPPVIDDPFEDGDVPEVDRAQLTPEVLQVALARHGCLLVRGLVGSEDCDALAGDMRRAFASAEQHHGDDGSADRWYRPFDAADGYSFGAMERGFSRALGSVLTVESPGALARVVDVFDRVGVRELLASYFGEPPVISAKKSTLRRATVESPTEWHQDGAFLGRDTRTVNIWVSVTPSGGSAPGIEVVPHAFDGIVETGTDGALFDWSVAHSRAVAVAASPPVSPRFDAGDALLFNQLTLHRTGIRPDMTDERLAIETWFFAPSTYPHEQVPILF